MDTFAAGGPFMIPITIIGLIMLGLGVYVIARAFSRQQPANIQALKGLVLQLGVFAFFTGLLSQAIGLMQAFQAIQQIGDVSPAIVAGGLYVSFIAPVWGLIQLLLGLALYMVATYRLARRS
jgi:vacuolar-type H+-ATPase subunit I/STV1